MPFPNGSKVHRSRTYAGTASRALVVMAVALFAIVSAAWLGSGVVRYDERLAMVSAVPAAFVVGILPVASLRARNSYIAGPLLGTLTAALAGAYLLHGNVLAGGHLQVGGSRWRSYEEVLFAAGTFIALTSVAGAAVSGHRDRRPATADQRSMDL